MDKQLLERIALEVVKGIQVPLMPEGNTYFVPNDLAIEFAKRFLTRIDAERGKGAAAWVDPKHEDLSWNHSSYFTIPLSLTPTIPEGMALVPDVPNRAMNAVMMEDEWDWDDLLAAAQGELHG